jgi:hypothetical protein
MVSFLSRVSRSVSILPFNSITNYLVGVARELLTVHADEGTRLLLSLYRPCEIDLSRQGVIPCIVIVCSGHSVWEWDDVMYRYATHGFAVLAYAGRRHAKLDDMFARTEVEDLTDVHRFVKSQLQWVRSDAMFVLGKSYASGVVLRCLASPDNQYMGGMVLSPVPYVSSIVSQDGNTIPVASHASVSMIQREMGIHSVAAHQFTSSTTPSDLRAQRILIIDQDDRVRYKLDDIIVPLYVHVNIGDTMVNLYDTVQLFATLYDKQPRSCIRYAHGVHGASETTSRSKFQIYDDALQWCRAILHNGSTQAYKTEVISTSTGLITSTSINPTSDILKYTISDNKKIVCSTYIPTIMSTICIDSIVQKLVNGYVPLRTLLQIHRNIMWNRVFTRSLDISGFPVLSLFVDTKTPYSGFGITLLEYDRHGFGKRLSYKYILLQDTHVSSDPIVVRMSMIASRLHRGQELVLVVSNYDSRFTYTGRTNATITFTNITLPYLFEY